MEQKNGGFTLVELIVSIGILALVGIGIGTVAYQGVRQYRASGTEVSVQQEAQLTGNQLKNLIMDANDGVSEWGGSLNLYSYEAEADTRRKHVVTYDGEERKLLFTGYIEEKQADGSRVWKAEVNGTGECLAEYVSAFSVTLLDAEGRTVTTAEDRGSTKARQVRMRISYELDGKSYELDQTVALRNRVLAGNLGTEADGD